mgnify:CR=1 FL=1
MAALTPTVSGLCWLVADRCTGDAEVPTDHGTVRSLIVTEDME